jgi:hypothetical protein
MSHWESSRGASDEWYTPPYVFEALGETFDMDVASPGFPHAEWVPAGHLLTKNSLEQPWEGFVWMNPPYGGRGSLALWLDKFFAHGDGLALVPDRTSAPWFHDAWQKADSVLFTRKIRFLRPDGSEVAQPSNGTAIMAAGNRGVMALVRASMRGLGILAMLT